MRSRLSLSVLLLAFFVGSCGGGGGGGAPLAPTEDTATVGLLITDGPSLQVDEAIATITSVRLIGEAGQVTLFSGSETLDLLKLGDYSELFAVSDDVPAGSYEKIRLILSDLVLINRDDSGAVIEEIHPKLVGNGKIDLNPRGPFTVAPGDVLFIELDFDVAKSLMITETGNGKVIVRPVVFVDIRSDRSVDGLSRIHGEITAIDAVNGTLRLCQSDLTAEAGEDDDDDPVNREHCVSVLTGEGTGIFNGDGLPAGFEDLDVGDEATAIGRLRSLTADLDIPDAELPPAGQCRLWLPAPVPSEQPAAGDCDVIAEDIPPAAVLVNEAGHVVGGDAFALEAYVIELGPLGTFVPLAGTALGSVDALSGRFDLALDPGQGFGSDTTLSTLVQEGTRVFDREGVELGTDAVTAGAHVLVDGVVALAEEGGAEPDTLRAALIVIGEEAGEIALEGEVLDVDVGDGTLTMSTGAGDRCVSAAQADVFLVSDDDGFTSTRGALADLTAGQAIVAFGTEGTDGCLTATTILAEL